MNAYPADTSHPAVAATAAAPGLYRQVLGPRYDLLSARLRALHGRQGLRAYRGEVVAERGRSWLSRLCAWAARLPPAYAGAIEVEIAGDAASGCLGLIWPRKLPIGWRALRIGLPGYTVLSRQLGIEQVQALGCQQVEQLPGLGVGDDELHQDRFFTGQLEKVRPMQPMHYYDIFAQPES